MSAQREGVALATLLRRVPGAHQRSGDAGVTVTSVVADSRQAGPGSLFVALRGEHVDGHDFVDAAFRNGAVAAVVEHGALRGGASGATIVEVERPYRALSSIASEFYGNPSEQLCIVGVTGTNGKTTTTRMIAEIANAAGKLCGIIGTIGAAFGKHQWRLAHTTPFPHELHATLAHMRDAGASTVAMEVSSHALALERVADVRFSCAVLTNVTRDHLDFHGTQEAYAAAKRRLFSIADAAVLNVDDAYGDLWSRELAGTIPVVTYAQSHQAELAPANVRVSARGSEFRLGERAFSLPLPARFNVSNALAAIGVARVLRIGDDVSARALASLTTVPGRMERFTAHGIDVVVDYAHTPDALEQALRALREITTGRLAVVFGCGGDRDRGKRPEMGAIAATLADRIYVTSDNPRSEDPMAIARAIVSGMGDRPHTLELDRRIAIERAIDEAQEGDVVLVAGKGHETYQIVGEVAMPFDDTAVARDALARRDT